MALIKCSECGKEISDNAVACPSCGNPMSIEDAEENAPVEIELTSKKWKKRSVWGIIFLVVSFIIMSNNLGLGLFFFFFAACYDIYVGVGRWWSNG